MASTLGNPPSFAPLAGIYNIDQMPSLTYQLGSFTQSSVQDNLTALGTTQATAYQMVATTNRFTTVTGSNYGGLLPVASGGLAIRVINSSANPLSVYPQSGSSINGAAVNTPYILMPNSTLEAYASDTTNWQTNYSAANPLPQVQYMPVATATSFTLTGPQMAGAADVTVNLTGALTANSTVTSPTAAQILAAIPNSVAGTSYNLRIINSSTGAFTWTLAANTGVTLGTYGYTMAQNTWRDFYVTATSLAAVTIQEVGTGTQS